MVEIKASKEEEEGAAMKGGYADEEARLIDPKSPPPPRRCSRCCRFSWRAYLCGSCLLLALLVCLIVLLTLLQTALPQSVVLINATQLKQTNLWQEHGFNYYFAQGFANYSSPQQQSNTGQPQQQEWQLGRKSGNWTTYPFTMEDFNRSYQPGVDTQCEMWKIMQRLIRGEEITFAAYGGSITAGHACSSSYWPGHTCAWPSRVELLLKHAYPEYKIKVVNKAMPAWGMRQFNGLVEQPDIADAYFLEFALNDSPPEAATQFVQKLRGPKLMVSMARGCGDNWNECEFYRKRFSCSPKCDPRYGEILVVPNLGHARRPGESNFNLNGPSYTLGKFWDMANNLDYFKPKFTFISVRDFIWPKQFKPRKDYGTIWNGMSHPDTVGQDLIAHAVFYGVTREIDYALLQESENVKCRTQSVVANKACDRLFNFDGKKPENATGPVQSTGWRLFADRPDKPGFIATEFGNTSELTFLVPIKQSITVGYLKSYENVFVTQIAIEGCEGEIDLNPLWTEHSSTTEAMTFAANGEASPERIILPCLANENNTARNRHVTFKARVGKFKIVTVFSC